MLSPTKIKHSSKPSKARGLSKKTKHQLIGTTLIVCGLVCAAIGYLVIIQSNDSSDSRMASLYVDTSTQTVSAGHSVTLEVWEDSHNQPVNAVQANISYPTSKFKFMNIDSNGSAFEIEAQSTAKNGLIKIARGHIGNVKGTQLVAKINLVARSDSGRATVNFTDGTAVIRSTDNNDILGATAVEHLTLASLRSSNAAAIMYKP